MEQVFNQENLYITEGDPVAIFPNGFDSWHETHFEVVSFLVTTTHYSGSLADKAQKEGGHGALYELAEKLTNEFEEQNKGREWDGDFFDAIENFLLIKNRFE